MPLGYGSGLAGLHMKGMYVGEFSIPENLLALGGATPPESTRSKDVNASNKTRQIKRHLNIPATLPYLGP